MGLEYDPWSFYAFYIWSVNQLNPKIAVKLFV